MAANPNMKAIQTVTVGVSGASNITFSSIPQTYTDLKIVLSARTNRSGFSYDNIVIYPNGSSSSLSGRYILGYGSGYTAGTDTSGLGAAGADGDSATGSVFSNVEIYIPNYTSSINKPFITDAVLENNGTDGRQGMTASLWSNTAAITSLEIRPSSGPNFVQFTTATLYGITSAAVSAKATGGIIYSDANYYYHAFLSSGVFTPSAAITNADFLVVAGGGGGGGGYSTNAKGGGGGAGGLRTSAGTSGGGASAQSKVNFSSGVNYTVTVGAGGSGGQGSSGGGSSGSASSIAGSGFTTISTTGGGYGSQFGGGASSGGSGGGVGVGVGGYSAGSSGNGAAGTANEGYAGGGGLNYTNDGNGGGGGGGGAGAAGFNAYGSQTAGAGGAGVASTILLGVSTTYAGGGGGASAYSPGNGGAGGGGAGGVSDGGGTSGTKNTGGGGGGGSSQPSNTTGGSGGGGIVIIRYAK